LGSFDSRSARSGRQKEAFFAIILNEGCRSEGSTRSDFVFIGTPKC
jgi:hypothetical protein